MTATGEQSSNAVQQLLLNISLGVESVIFGDNRCHRKDLVSQWSSDQNVASCPK